MVRLLLRILFVIFIYCFSLSNELLGQVRPPHLVKNKIEHLIRSYKMAKEVVQSSGEGLVDDEYDSFMNMIRKRYCKWYDALDSVLANRHNVTAAYTNESRVENEHEHSDNANKRNKNDRDCSYSSNLDQQKQHITVDTDEDEDDSDPYSSSSSSAVNKEKGKGQSNKGNNNSRESPKKKTKTSTTDNKLSYLEAANRRRLKKKSIVANKRGGGSSDFSDRTSEHFDRMYNIHTEKMANQAMQRRQQLAIEDRKLKIEEEKMKQNDILVKLKEQKLKGEVMQGTIQYNFDVMKKRKEMKQLYPEMSDEEINKLLPLRDVFN